MRPNDEASRRMRLTIPRPRFTIERLRNVLLVGGALLVVAIVVFLAAGQWTRRFLNKDLPSRLGINIEQHADVVTYTQTRKGKTIFKIQSSRADTMKSDGSTLLHDVKIDLYGEDGNRTDTISGSEFNYDPKAGVATAAGAVEITMMRPGVKPAITQLKPGSAKPKPAVEDKKAVSAPTSANSSIAPTPGSIANEITDDEIHVKTNGLIFNQKTGVATTTQRVDFALRQGNGNSIGATYDSQHGQLVLDRAVELLVHRPSGAVAVHAGHAEFEHGNMLCRLTSARADYTGGSAQTENALIHFRADGSVIQLDGSGGVDLMTKSGGHVTAPIGTLEFDEANHPRHGLLQGGAHLELIEPNRTVEGSSPTARLVFNQTGQLSTAHMEQGVIFSSQQQVTTAKGVGAQVHRTWKSQIADVVFAAAPNNSSGARKPGPTRDDLQVHTTSQSRVEPRTIHGYGGVVITSETSSAGVTTPSRLSADSVDADLAPGGALSSLLGTGHASFEERSAAGVHQASTSDQLNVHFVSASLSQPKSVSGVTAAKPRDAGPGSEIESIVETGHVVLVQDPPDRVATNHSGPTVSPSGNQTGLRATANRADYDGQSQILHLTGSPRVRDGALDMTANRIDFTRASGDAYAHGDVRASWIGSGAQDGAQSGNPTVNPPLPGRTLLGATQSGSGGNGPVHAIAPEAELHQSSQEVIFRGSANGSEASQPRLWQSVNSVSAPVIILNRQKETLTAEASGATNPVRTVLVSNPPQKVTKETAGRNQASKDKQEGPSVIRVRSGDLHYSEGERLAHFRSGSVGSVTAETTGTGGTATVVSQEADVKLLPEGTNSSHTGDPGAVRVQAGATKLSGPSGAAPINASIDNLTARGHVIVDWPDRRGSGDKLVYVGDDGNFTLTGTSSVPPRITDLSDRSQGTVTGSVLIYHSRDGSVSVEGDGVKTETQTRSRK